MTIDRKTCLFWLKSQEVGVVQVIIIQLSQKAIEFFNDVDCQIMRKNAKHCRERFYNYSATAWENEPDVRPKTLLSLISHRIRIRCSNTDNIKAAYNRLLFNEACW